MSQMMTTTTRLLVLIALGVPATALAGQPGGAPLSTAEERARYCSAWLAGLDAHPAHEMYKSVVSVVSRKPRKPMTHQVRWDRRRPGKIYVSRKHAGKHTPYVPGERSHPLPHDNVMTVDFRVGYLDERTPGLLVCMAIPGEQGASAASVVFPFGRKTLEPAAD